MKIGMLSQIIYIS